MHKRDDGFVVVNEMSASAAATHMACPYGAPQYNAAKGHMTRSATAAMTASQRGKNRFAWSPVRCARWTSAIDPLRKNTASLRLSRPHRPRTSRSQAL